MRIRLGGAGNLGQEPLFFVARNGHFAGGNLGFSGVNEAQLAASKGIAFTHARGRPEYPAGHGTPFIDIAEARRRAQRRTGGLVGKFLEAGLVLVGRAQQPSRKLAGKRRTMLGDPGAGAFFDRLGP